MCPVIVARLHNRRSNRGREVLPSTAARDRQACVRKAEGDGFVVFDDQKEGAAHYFFSFGGSNSVFTSSISSLMSLNFR
jgi:lauroyl/myristoyl acyltransferase